MSKTNDRQVIEEKDQLILTESDLSDSESDLSSDSDLNERSDTKLASKESPAPPDPRFHQPPPSPFKRIALVLFTLLLLWIAFSLRRSLWAAKKSPKVIYASRYSKEHRFRPAASPIITETLKDGRIRIRGAGPTATPTPKPKPAARKTKRAARKARKAVRKPSPRK